MMRVPTLKGEVVTLCCFAARRGTLEILRELQTMLPRYELMLSPGVFVPVASLDFNTEAIQHLNHEDEAA
jgi:hypothetical protein